MPLSPGTSFMVLAIRRFFFLTPAKTQIFVRLAICAQCTSAVASNRVPMHVACMRSKVLIVIRICLAVAFCRHQIYSRSHCIYAGLTNVFNLFYFFLFIIAMKEARFMVATGAPRTSAFHFHSQFDKNHAVSIAACSQNDINGGNRNPMPVIDPRFDSIKTLNKMLAIASPRIERERENKTKRKE